MSHPALQDWHERAGVRTDPRRVLHDELDQGRTFFPLRLIPHLDHELVRALPPEAVSDLVARHLYQYLQFTAQFELRVVNRAAERIADGRLGRPLSPGSRMDAYKIYCDEAYHALASVDVLHQIEQASGVPARRYDFEPFLGRLDGVGPRVLPGEPILAELLQVVVFETLVTSILNEVPQDPSVVGVVRETVRDHARDEGRHHAFFSRFFQELWAGLDRPLRERAARALPELIELSLRPDLRPVRSALGESGLDAAASATVLTDAYAPDKVRDRIRAASRHSVRLFAATGVLDEPGGREAFQARGLIGGER